MRFSDKVVVITGAAGGLGHTTARIIGGEGGTLALIDRDQSRLAEATVETGGTAISADLTAETEVAKTIATILDLHGRIDVLINCAGGYTEYKGLAALSEADWDSTIASNLKSTFLCCRAVLPAMIDRKYGRIVNIASVAARTYSYFLGAAYTAAKAGVLGLTRQIAHEYGRQGICANAVAPTAFHGERLHAMLSSEQERDVKERTPLGRIPEASEIASVVAFLASEDASFMSGATLDVNGALVTP